jgi:hypothetical protein
MLNIMAFFGVLIPGAVCTFLLMSQFRDCVTWLNSLPGELQTSEQWVLAFFASIIFGHLLQGFSNWLDIYLASWHPSKPTKASWEDPCLRQSLKLPQTLQEKLDELRTKKGAARDTGPLFNLKENLKEKRFKKYLFYSAFNFLRIHNPAGVSELERHAADYKLFRSLTLLVFLDILLSAACFQLTGKSLLVSLIILFLIAWRFRQIFDFAYGLAFDLCRQVSTASANDITEDKAGEEEPKA